MRALVVGFGLTLALGCGNDSTSPAAGGPEFASAKRYLPKTDLGTLGGDNSFAYALNDQGVVVGAAQTSTGDFHAFRWTLQDGLVDLGTLPGVTSSSARAIARNGDIVGVSGEALVRWRRGGTIENLSGTQFAGAGALNVTGVNSRGEIVGYAGQGSWTTGSDFTLHAWYWSSGTGLVDVGPQGPSSSENFFTGINESGLAAATSAGSPLLEAWSWSRKGGVDLVGSLPAHPTRTAAATRGINNHGAIAGFLFVDTDFPPPIVLAEPIDGAYVWHRSSGFRLLPGLTCCGHYAEDVNDRGWAVGASPDAAGFHAVVWTPDGVIGLLEDGIVAHAVNKAGLVAGWSAAGAVNRATVWNANNAQPPTGLAARNAPRRVAPIDRGSSCLATRTARVNLPACLEGR